LASYRHQPWIGAPRRLLRVSRIGFYLFLVLGLFTSALASTPGWMRVGTAIEEQSETRAEQSQDGEGGSVDAGTRSGASVRRAALRRRRRWSSLLPQHKSTRRLSDRRRSRNGATQGHRLQNGDL